MMHSEFIRLVPSASAAVVFIHGILGTPRHFDDFVSLVPDNVSVYNILLDGHGKGVREFSRSSMKKWESQVSELLSTVCSAHHKVYIAAHSMGTLFAVNEAVCKAEIKGMFLLAAPLRLFIKPRLIRNTMKVYFNKFSSDDEQAIAAKRCYSITDSRNILSYLGWIPRYLELFAKIRTTRKIIHRLNTPCLVYQSKLDEMVSLRACKDLRKSDTTKVKILRKSCHYYYDSRDYEYLFGEFRGFVAGI